MEYYISTSRPVRAGVIQKRMNALHNTITKGQTTSARACMSTHRMKRQRASEAAQEPIKHQRAVVAENLSRVSSETNKLNVLFFNFNKQHASSDMDVTIIRTDGKYHVKISAEDLLLSFDKVIQRLEGMKQDLSALDQQVVDQKLALSHAQELLNSERLKLKELEKEKEKAEAEASKKDEKELEAEIAGIYGDAYHEFERLKEEWNGGTGECCGKCHRVLRIQGDVSSFTVADHYNGTDYGGYYVCN